MAIVGQASGKRWAVIEGELWLALGLLDLAGLLALGLLALELLVLGLLALGLLSLGLLSRSFPF